MPVKRKLPLMIYCGSGFKARLKAHAAARNMSMSAYVRAVVNAEMDNTERGSPIAKLLKVFRFRRQKALPPPQ